MVAYAVLISLFLLEAAVGDQLMRPAKKCIPTSTIVGARHVCVCSVDGIYHCREETSRRDLLEAPDLKHRECEPNELYRENTTFCSCTASGHWLSDNCRERFHRLIPKKDPIRKHLRTTIACKPSALYITDCNVCLCKASGVIDFDSCTSRLCPKLHKGDYCNPGDVFRSANEFCICSFVNYYLDRLCLKVVDKVVEPVRPEDLAKIIDTGSHSIINETECEANPPLSRQRVKDLPEIKEGEPCTPGKSYRIDCKRCYCSEAPTLVCTKRACIDWPNFINHKGGKLRRGAKITKLQAGLKAGKSKRSGKISGRSGEPSGPPVMSILPNMPKEKCVPGKIYNESCRRCFCSNLRKISCSENADGACKLLEDGLPSPIVTPEDVRPPFVSEDLKMAPSLPSASEKCEPGETYIVSCNKCICTERYNLLCTRSLCLSFDDINRVEADERTGQKCIGNIVTKESCIECKCIKGKLACNRILGCITETRNKLSKTANSTLLKMQIDPVHDNCIPGAIYKDNCNHCYCQSDASLRCTQKTCLNYAQSKLLDEQFELLEKEGA